jgi:uncharacterized protein YjdB
MVAFMLLAVSYVSAQGPFYPSIDTYIDQTQTTTVNNTTNPTKLEVRKASNSNERTTFIEFSIGSESTIVVKAELNIWLFETANAANSEGISVYEVTAGSFSNATTWANIGAYTLGTALSTKTITTTGGTSQPNITANGWYKFDITSLYNRVAGEAGTDKKIRLCLKALNANLVLRFSSSETTLGAQYKPYLSTTTTVVSVTGVSVSPSTANVGVGAKTNLTATVAPANATNQTVAWSSSNNSIATVSATGEVTGVSVGDATITATTQDGSFTSTSLISVVFIPVSGVVVSPSTASIVTGANTTLTATFAPTNATNKTVTWASSNTAVATVSATGVVTALTVGATTITATTQDGSFTSSSTITVGVPAANYALNPSFELNTAPSANATNWFKWTGSSNNYIINSSVVTGNSGLGDAVGGTPHAGTNYLSIVPSVTWPTTYDVLNKQDLTGLPNGTYTLKGWFRGNGGTGYFNIGGTYINYTMPMAQWTQIVINNFNVTNGTATINIQYNSTTGKQLDVDDIQFTLNQPSITTGSPIVSKNSDISIYPTVIANNVLNISNAVKGNYEVSISNINGQAMYTNKLNSGNVCINTSFLKTGMYLVRVSNGIDNRVHKVIVP